MTNCDKNDPCRTLLQMCVFDYELFKKKKKKTAFTKI